MNDDKTGITLPPIGVAELIEHVANNDVFVLDLRRNTHGKQIYGAIRYDPKKLLDAPRLTLPLPQNSGLIVVYDENGTSSDVAAIGDKLRENGYGEVRALEGGFKAYETANGKTEEMTMEQPVPLVSEHQLDR